MLIMILENVPASVRGEISRWMLEPKAGVFIGHVSALVREKLWEKACQNRQVGGVLQAWSTNTEQHYQMRMDGYTTRKIQDWEGLQLILVPDAEATKKRRALAKAAQEDLDTSDGLMDYRMA